MDGIFLKEITPNPIEKSFGKDGSYITLNIEEQLEKIIKSNFDSVLSFDNWPVLGEKMRFFQAKNKNCDTKTIIPFCLNTDGVCTFKNTTKQLYPIFITLLPLEKSQR